MLPSNASTILSNAASMGEPETSRLSTPRLLVTFFDFLPLSPSFTNSALLQRTAMRARFFHEGVRRSKDTAGVPSAPVSTSPMLLSNQMWATVGWFLVKVPVLSHSRTEVEPERMVLLHFIVDFKLL